MEHSKICTTQRYPLALKALIAPSTSYFMKFSPPFDQSLAKLWVLGFVLMIIFRENDVIPFPGLVGFRKSWRPLPPRITTDI